MGLRSARPVLGLSLLAFIGCRPELGDRDSRVTAARIIAVRAEPPEARAGNPVTYSVLVATPPETASTAAVDWAFCASPKALAENNVVSSACLGDGVKPFGPSTPAVAAATPGDACSLFGPESPPGNFRPRDPDATGGYFQPVRAIVAGDVAFGLLRVRCNLANAPVDIAQDFGRRYLLNKNPKLFPLRVTVDGTPRETDQIPAGRQVVLDASWAPDDAEAYVSFDIASQAVVDRRESMRVSWFATGGTFEADRTGRTELEHESTSANGWTAPDSPGPATLWVVLRDSRGGMDYATYPLTIVP